MDADRFWELTKGLAPEDAADQLENRLSELAPEEIESFQEHFDRAFALAYNWNLWAAAYIIDGGCSDDGFMDFRYGLISRGRDIFDAAIANPESLLDVANNTDTGFIPNECFGYAARKAYEAMTNHQLPDNTVVHPADPSGEYWDFDDEQLCKQKLTKLWDTF